jgi:hypothetical protein
VRRGRRPRAAGRATSACRAAAAMVKRRRGQRPRAAGIDGGGRRCLGSRRRMEVRGGVGRHRWEK